MSSVFRVNLNGTPQASVPNNAYQQIAWSGVAQDECGLWTTQGCVPPAGDVMFAWQVWVCAGFGGPNAQIVAKLIKNATVNAAGALVSGTDVAAAIGGPGAQAGTACCGASAADVANGTDTYNLFLWVSSSNPNVGCTIDGNPAHTWFSALSI